MKYKRYVILIVVLLLVAAVAQAGGRTRAASKPSNDQLTIVSQQVTALSRVYSDAELSKGVYVGSEICLLCHTNYTSWRDTKHSKALRRPFGAYSLAAGKGVVADYDSNGVDDFKQGLNFNDISSVFDPYKPNAPILSFDAATDTYFITIGQLKMPVVILQGGNGDWKQRFLVRIPVSDAKDGLSEENYLSPIQYNEPNRKYSLYKDTAWWDATSKQPKFAPGMTMATIAGATSLSYSKNCIGCHTTGIKELGKNANGEWKYKGWPAVLHAIDDPSYVDWDHDGVDEMVNVGCEACHGPGSAHIVAAGSPAKIVNPKKLTAAKANEVCGNCHGRYASVPSGTHEFPYDETTKTYYQPGSQLALSTFVKSAAGRWPDGTSSKQHHQQYDDLYKSSKPTYQYHAVTCFECHDPHGGTGNRAQIVSSIVDGALTIPTRANDNTLCLACHATHGPFAGITKEQVAKYDENLESIGKVVSAHTHHPAAPSRSMGLSRCTGCHMPLVAQSSVPYDIRSHTFETIAPEKTLKYQADKGMPNACAGCHGMKVNVFGFGLNPSLSTWNEPFDVATAEKLKFYFGPGGVWWNTTEATSKAGRAVATSAAPGTVPAPTQED